MSSPEKGPPAGVAAFTHLLADFSGVAVSQLCDASLLSGLLIAAASGAGLTAIGPPLVRQRPDGGLGGILLLEQCHIAAHTVPARGLLLVDVLVPHAHEARKAISIFARRFAATTLRLDDRTRG